MFKKRTYDYMFFSVDVETSGLTPSSGKLLTVGIVPVKHSKTWGWVTCARTQYIRLNQGTEFADGIYSSMPWWNQQHEDVRGEAYEDRSLLRLDPIAAAKIMNDYLNSFEPDPMKRFFVANPVSFDKPWIDDLFVQAGLPLPFHYRSLCLRSMDFGMNPRKSFGESRNGMESTVPHHALHDALAQAYDLTEMLNRKKFPWL